MGSRRSFYPASCYENGILLVSAYAILLRILVSFHSYSGANTPPKFGDYEAQRHWMEITIHTPIVDWYRNTIDNDLGWWGLDYPPVTAYQSYVHGLLVHAVEPDAVALHSSRGYETPSSKILMRWTVLSSDILLFFPGALWFVNVFYCRLAEGEKTQALAMILLQPTLMLIDHGHFQYNCISLGLAVAAVAAIVSRRELLACVLFSVSLNHKQMSMYYAPAFFAHLLGRSFQRRYPTLRVLTLGCTVILTFVVCWFPYLRSKEAALEVLSRIAPLQRGIYEDYVANFWCGTAMFFKWKQRFTQPILAKLALGATILASLPSMIQQIRAPSGKGFIYAMLNSAFAFYFFSYQVHEKSVLLPVIPASLLALEETQVFRWVVPFAAFSMLPLLCRDGQLIPYISLMALFFLISRFSRVEAETSPGGYSRLPVLGWRVPSAIPLAFLSAGGALALHLAYFTLQPPKRYPYLFEALIMCYSFMHFLAVALFTNWKQWKMPEDFPSKEKVG